jgi:transposase
MPSRIEKKLLKLLDQVAVLDQRRLLVEAELEAHRHIDDDAQRDAALGIEPLEATSTRDDVARFERLLADIDYRREALEQRRTHLLSRLGS